MKKYFILFFIFFKIGYSFTQSISTTFGVTYTKDKAVVPIINQNNLPTGNDWYFIGLNYEHFTSSKFSYHLQYTNYQDVTYITPDTAGYHDGSGYPISAVGWPGVKVHRLDFGAGYNIFKNRKIILQPFITISFQQAFYRGWEYYDSWINGPHYYQTAPMKAEAFNIFQITPGFGLKAGYAFANRYELFLKFNQIYGYRAYQRLTLTYTYKGVPQPNAVYESNGTGYFIALGLGYRIGKKFGRRNAHI
jgi:hypothetical protein